MKIRPLYDRIVVKRVEDEGESKVGGLFVPDSAKEKPQQGEVVAVGKGKRADDGKLIPLDVLFGNPDRAQPHLSPDGTKLAFLAPDEGVLNVFVSIFAFIHI